MQVLALLAHLYTIERCDPPPPFFTSPSFRYKRLLTAHCLSKCSRRLPLHLTSPALPSPSHRVEGPFLVVAPLSVLDSWVTHLNTHLPLFRVLKHHGGDAEQRAEAFQVNYN